MIAAIEDALVAYLQAQFGTAIRIAIQKGFEGIPQPGIYVATDEGRFQRTSNNAFRQTNTIFIDIIFKGLNTEALRREGLYGVMEVAINSLAWQTLGLAIHPIEPKSFRNVTTEEMLRDGFVAYTLEVETWYQVTKMEPADAPELLSASFGYYLNAPVEEPAGTPPDASDLIETPGE
jgi:phage gp37-like protein